jgi:protease-4
MTFFSYIKSIFMLLLFLLVAPTIFENLRRQYSHILSPKTQVGVIKIYGEICNSSRFIKQLHSFFSDNEIKAIVLNIESCGGAAGTGQALAQELLALNKKYPKPIIALTENICASGAYYIASATDHIISSGQALIGSIGSYIPHLFHLNKLIQKYDIDCTLIKAGTYKAITDPFVPLNDDDKAHLQAVVDSSYEQFIEDIAHNRKLALQDAGQWADGKIFTGKQAKELSLVDELGSVSQATAYIKDKLLLEGDIEWIKATSQKSLLQELFNSDDSDDCGLFSTAWRTAIPLIEKVSFGQPRLLK